MTEEQMEELLAQAIDNCKYEEDESFIEEFAGSRSRTFSDAGVLTMNKGLVIHLANGEEFQVTIVRSR